MLSMLLSNFQSMIVFLIVLGVLVAVHEWGHFITAKWFGVQVDEFSIGFGKTLYKKHYNGTDYLIKAIPLGGYVKMAGDERDKCTGDPKEFYSKPVGQRAWVVFNGPLVNVIMAYACMILVFLIGYPGLSTKVNFIEPGSPAMEAGLQVGDQIKEINGKTVYGWISLDRRIISDGKEPINVTFERNGQEQTVQVSPEIVNKPNILGIKKDLPDIGIGNLSNVIGHVSEDFPAELAGLQQGDRIMSINGTEIRAWDQLQDVIQDAPEGSLGVVIERDGQLMTKSIEPKIVETKKKKKKQIGVAPEQNLEMFRFGFLDSLVLAYDKLYEITVLTYESLYSIISGQMAARESMTGPIGIFYIVKSAAAMGFSHLLYIVALISMSLAIFNLLPIIPLDGGHLFLYAIEKIRGKELPVQVDEWVARFGVTMILMLAAFVFYSDFDRFGWFDAIKNIFVQ